MSDQFKFQLKSLHKSFGTNHVLKGINLDIKKDRSLVILGGSGSGKSVLIKTIVGLLAPDSGSILYDGKDSINLSSIERLNILENGGYLFQAGALFDSMTVEQNITFFAKKLYDLSKSDIKDLASKKLHSVGLSSRILDLYPSELSGGMQKRVALARAVCTDPKVIFFDEPTTGLDPIMANIINELIIKLRHELGATTITITHDMQSLHKIAQDVAFLYDGKITWQGPINELDKSEDLYLQKFITGDTTDALII